MLGAPPGGLPGSHFWRLSDRSVKMNRTLKHTYLFASSAGFGAGAGGGGIGARPGKTLFRMPVLGSPSRMALGAAGAPATPWPLGSVGGTG